MSWPLRVRVGRMPCCLQHLGTWARWGDFGVTCSETFSEGGSASTSGLSESEFHSLSSPWRTEMVVSLMFRSCLHALSMPLSVLPALRNTIKRLFWRLTTKQALLGSSFTLGLPQCRAIFCFKSETSCHSLASSLSQLEAPWVVNFQAGWDRSKRKALGCSLRRLGNNFLGTDV